ncbi:hypothetical protein GCM10009841_25780 [Microlunatus panaciterrae]|uniref:Undecaprenyl-diphosphatase n=1 Tax=Microlunatus panaciterrae TaxID=400768 RepID=A0ABS2RKN5_9ACTN|nr:hypothetical protein [Microlunatus panaciterrae]MBM7799137.1 hypothetical protein [Microlunatus panaciterrae]
MAVGTLFVVIMIRANATYRLGRATIRWSFLYATFGLVTLEVGLRL